MPRSASASPLSAGSRSYGDLTPLDEEARRRLEKLALIDFG
jgi:hypothetical protein